MFYFLKQLFNIFSIWMAGSKFTSIELKVIKLI